MAEFDVTLSAMEGAQKNIINYIQQFREHADGVYQAVQTLGEGWQGDASQDFANNMEQLHNWMNELSVVLDEYTAALGKSHDTYQQTDESAAKNFK